MSLSLRNKRGALYAYADSGSDGIVSSSYGLMGTYWVGLEQTSGMEETLGSGAEHKIQATIVFADDVTVPFDSIVTIDGKDYKTGTVLARPRARELRVAAVYSETATYVKV